MACFKRVVYQDLCRLCASDKNPKVDMYEESGKNLELISKILACLSLKVQSDDGLPKKVCEKCVSKLDSFFFFKNACKSAENLLSKYFMSMKQNNTQDGTVYIPENNNCEQANKNWQNLSPQINKQFLPSSLSLQQDSDVGNIDGIIPTIQLLEADANQRQTILLSDQSNSDGVVNVDEVLFSNQVCDLVDGWKLSAEGDKDSDLGLNSTDLSQIQNIWNLPTQLQQDKVENKSDSSVLMLTTNMEDLVKMNENEKLMSGISQEIDIQPHAPDTQYLTTVVNDNSLSSAITLPENGEVLLLNVDKDNFLTFNNSEPTIFILNDPVKGDSVCETFTPLLVDNSVKGSSGGGPIPLTFGNTKLLESGENLGISLGNPPVVLLQQPNKAKPPKVRKEPPKCFVCDKCGKSYKKESLLEEHISSNHTGEKQYACQACDKKYFRKVHLMRHLNEHRQKKQWICQFCDKEFSRKDNYVSHMKVHTTKIDTCQTCGKKFLIRELYLQHVYSQCDSFKAIKNDNNKARENKWHPCEVCGKGFPLASRLSRHKLTHLKMMSKEIVTKSEESGSFLIEKRQVISKMPTVRKKVDVIVVSNEPSSAVVPESKSVDGPGVNIAKDTPQPNSEVQELSSLQIHSLLKQPVNPKSAPLADFQSP